MAAAIAVARIEERVSSKRISVNVETEDERLRSAAKGLLMPLVKTRRVVIVFLLFTAIACSVAPMFGDDKGWLYWSKERFDVEGSPYVALLKYVLQVEGSTGVDPEDLDVLNPFLPDIPSDVSAELGWRNSISSTTLHTEEADPIADFLKPMALQIVPPDFADEVDSIFDEGKVSLKEDYVGRREAAKFTGAFTVAFLGLSAIYAIVCLVMIAITRESLMGLRTMVDALLWKSWLAAGLLYVMVCTEYVVLAVGTHRELKEHPAVQKGYIAWPDWAWIIAMIAATCWAAIAILMLSFEYRHKNALKEPLPSKSYPVATKQSWNIPAAVDGAGDRSV